MPTIANSELGKHKLSMKNLRILSDILKLPVWYLGYFDKLPSDTFQQKIKKARCYNGLTKKEFADILFVGEKTIAAWEDGSQEPLPYNLVGLEKYIKNIG